jgi:hypothetical protein
MTVMQRNAKVMNRINTCIYCNLGCFHFYIETTLHASSKTPLSAFSSHVCYVMNRINLLRFRVFIFVHIELEMTLFSVRPR